MILGMPTATYTFLQLSPHNQGGGGHDGGAIHERRYPPAV